MDNNYFTWDKFVEKHGREMRIAAEVFESMTGSGLQVGCLCVFDFTFQSSGACADWKIALQRREQDAQALMDKYCNKSGVLTFWRRQ